MSLTVYISMEDLEKIVDKNNSEDLLSEEIKITGNLHKNENRYIQFLVDPKDIIKVFAPSETISFKCKTSGPDEWC